MTAPEEARFQLNPTVRWLFAATLALMGIGLLMVYSAGMSADPNERFVMFHRQVVFVPLAVVVLLVAMRLPYGWLNRWYVVLGFLAVTVVLLVAVLKFGAVVNGARRWFRFSLGPFDVSVQPSELAKLSLIVCFAWFLSRPQEQVRSFFRGFVPLTIVLGLVCGLVAIQDLGTAVLLGAIGGAMMIVGGVCWWHMATLVPPTAAAMYALIAFYPYRLTRLLTYLDPWKDAQDSGYHVTQSLMAIGSGGWFGRGLGQGMQKLGHLPEDTTDFIFSVISEEMGFVGGVMVILLFTTVVLLGLRVVGRSENRFAMLVSLGIALWIGLQAAINIGVATAALPTKGIALPLVSYGGSGLVLTAAALGLLMSVAARTPYLNAADGAPSPRELSLAGMQAA
ncbi:MAG: putative lipid II flippase FtsW [Planctomycetes bacterium]|nr:putative lipid II flippase FtsW [Planctomycetota bacterium]